MVNPDTRTASASNRLWFRWFVLTVGGQYAGMIAAYFGGFALLAAAFATIPGLSEFATVGIPTLLDPMTGIILAGITGAVAIYAAITALAQRFALPVPDWSWLLTCTLSTMAIALLVTIGLLGWLAVSQTMNSLTGTILTQLVAVVLGTLAGAAYGFLTSISLRFMQGDRRPWIAAATLSSAISALVITYLTFTNLPLVFLALLVRPWVDAAITATGLTASQAPADY